MSWFLQPCTHFVHLVARFSLPLCSVCAYSCSHFYPIFSFFQVESKGGWEKRNWNSQLDIYRIFCGSESVKRKLLDSLNYTTHFIFLFAIYWMIKSTHIIMIYKYTYRYGCTYTFIIVRRYYQGNYSCFL